MQGSIVQENEASLNCLWQNVLLTLCHDFLIIGDSLWRHLCPVILVHRGVYYPKCDSLLLAKPDDFAEICCSESRDCARAIALIVMSLDSTVQGSDLADEAAETQFISAQKHGFDFGLNDSIDQAKGDIFR